jgi:hypothetical protein
MGMTDDIAASKQKTDNFTVKPTSPVKKLGKLLSSSKAFAEIDLPNLKNSEKDGCGRNSGRKAKQKTTEAISKYFQQDDVPETEPNLKNVKSKTKVTVSKYFADEESGLDLDEDSKKYLRTLSTKVEALSDSGSDSDDVDGSSLASSSTPSVPLAQKPQPSVMLGIKDDDNSNFVSPPNSVGKKIDDSDFEYDAFNINLRGSSAKRRRSNIKENPKKERKPGTKRKCNVDVEVETRGLENMVNANCQSHVTEADFSECDMDNQDKHSPEQKCSNTSKRTGGKNSKEENGGAKSKKQTQRRGRGRKSLKNVPGNDGKAAKKPVKEKRKDAAPRGGGCGKKAVKAVVPTESEGDAESESEDEDWEEVAGNCLGVKTVDLILEGWLCPI